MTDETFDNMADRVVSIEQHLAKREEYVDQQLRENREAIQAVHADVAHVKRDIHDIRDNTQPIREMWMAMQGMGRIAKWLATAIGSLTALLAFIEALKVLN